jgi:hypothetical protein
LNQALSISKFLVFSASRRARREGGEEYKNMTSIFLSSLYILLFKESSLPTHAFILD